MSQLKHCLMATAGLVMLITAVARLNALNGDGISPHGSVHALFNLSAPVTGPFQATGSPWLTLATTPDGPLQSNVVRLTKQADQWSLKYKNGL